MPAVKFRKEHNRFNKRDIRHKWSHQRGKYWKVFTINSISEVENVHQEMDQFVWWMD